ncbi:hypothetical protein Hanom_Chr00s071259g01788921 [Helianthus anomalus]
MEINPTTAEEKFVPDWDIRNNDSSNVLVTKLYRRWIEAESVRENLEKETLSLKRKIKKSPDIEKKIAQHTQDLQVQQEKVKSLTTQSQSSQAASASAAEDRDRIAAELKSFSESMKKKKKKKKKKNEEHKGVLAKMEESFTNARLAYANMMAERDALKTGEAYLKAQIEDMKRHEEEIEVENAALKAKVEDLQAT